MPSRTPRWPARTSRRLQLVLVDIDHFKLYNDRYGHVQGDRALEAVGQVLRRCAARASDGAFRIGDEEFALVLPEASLAGARRVMRAVHDAMLELAQPRRDATGGLLSVSQGAAEIDGLGFERGVENADAALYRAKRDGRNRSATWPLAAAA